MDEQPLDEQIVNRKTLEFLKNAAVDDGARAYLFAAFKTDAAIHEMCMIRNGLDKKDPEYSKKYLFMEGAIKVMISEGNKLFNRGSAYAAARGEKYIGKEKDSLDANEEGEKANV